MSSQASVSEDIVMGRRNPKARIVTDSERKQMDEFIDSIRYSNRYNDDQYEYRHVELPKQMLKKIPKEYFRKDSNVLKLLWEDEWRGLGITQSLGWEHYEIHEPEPQMLLFKRALPMDERQQAQQTANGTDQRRSED